MHPISPRFSGTYRLVPAGVEKFPMAMCLMGQVAPGGDLYKQGIRAAFEDNRGDVLLIVGNNKDQDKIIDDALTALTLKDSTTYSKQKTNLKGKLTPW